MGRLKRLIVEFRGQLPLYRIATPTNFCNVIWVIIHELTVYMYTCSVAEWYRARLASLRRGFGSQPQKTGEQGSFLSPSPHYLYKTSKRAESDHSIACSVAPCQFSRTRHFHWLSTWNRLIMLLLNRMQAASKRAERDHSIACSAAPPASSEKRDIAIDFPIVE